MSAEIANKVAGKYDVGLEKEAAHWYHSWLCCLGQFLKWFAA